MPECLHEALQKIIATQPKGRKPVLVSSNGLANRFILSRWGIRPSQRRRYRQLFSLVRKQCRSVFQYYVSRGWVEWDTTSGNHLLGVYKFDEIRGNLILGFVPIPPGSEWKLSGR
ncbi:MAG: hypothetical protein C4K49_04370 [Candidatus Thorarchaeota archaeon]|nr:MAG: hypothetical protein C4K49_04370 [Candidatus Thorarchaeota archaeon]